MIMSDKIQILQPSTTKDNKGISHTVYNPISINNKDYLNCSFQPLRYSTNFKPYGITDKTSNVIYTSDEELMRRYKLDKDDPQQFNTGYRIGNLNNTYIINAILPYPRHLEIYLEKVI